MKMKRSDRWRPRNGNGKKLDIVEEEIARTSLPFERHCFYYS